MRDSPPVVFKDLDDVAFRIPCFASLVRCDRHYLLVALKGFRLIIAERFDARMALEVEPSGPVTGCSGCEVTAVGHGRAVVVEMTDAP